jgi:hypothetical protein
MQPFTVDPATYDKRQAYDAALAYVKAFLDLNGIAPVAEYLTEPDDTKQPPGNNPWHDKGWYWCGTLFVNLKKTRTPVKVPGFQWSFTGYKADLTAPGVLAHEVGHHVHFEIDRKREEHYYTLQLLEHIASVRHAEPAVSGYEPNLYEVFAEAMRLFILNPTLLAEGRPKRYSLLIGLGLKPLHQAPWREVLQHAHPKIIAATEKWIER